ncbi:hypothetical protein ACSLVN_28000, partial [Klebsiella pneumoniae]|uniref:hypothetical protein n=1 Tax=Klebsiella pneumoniae TaxID=573 RepID=UPI003EE19C32
VATLVLLAKGTKIDLEPSGPTLSAEHPVSLWLELSGKVSEHEPSLSDMVLTHLIGGDREVYLPELRSALRRAAKDD